LEPAIVDPELARRLDAAQVGWCVIGAAALAAHGYVRASDDIDLLTLAHFLRDVLHLEAHGGLLG
jgi:hypothetical protein